MAERLRSFMAAFDGSSSSPAGLMMVDVPPLLPPPPSSSAGAPPPLKNDDAPAGGCSSEELVDEYDAGVARAKIVSHPQYPRLLAAYLNCHKVGAPPEVVARLEEACRPPPPGTKIAGEEAAGDPALDQFMEAYCEMLVKYEEELSKPFKEAMFFLSRIDSHFNSLTLSDPLPPQSHLPHEGLNNEGCDKASGERSDMNGGASSDEDIEGVGEKYIDPQAEDKDLKGQLLRRYSGYLGGLKQEFLKKRKKGKLPKEARQQLLDWWSLHYKWPYPSESQKLALAESTGLDQKQINNWFINQRKRHWKPSEEMQLVVMDPTAAAAQPVHYYMDSGGTVAAHGNAFPLDCSSHALV